MIVLLALALAAPRTRPAQDPELAEALQAATWSDAESQVRAGVELELERIGAEPGYQGAVALERSRSSGDWQLRWQERAFEQAIVAEDPVAADAALRVLETHTLRSGLRWRLRWLRFRLLFPMIGPWALLAAVAYGAGRLLDSLTGRRQRPRRRKRLEYPFVTGRPLRDAGLVYGREAMLGRLLEVVHAGGCAYLTGERRIGKTTLLLQVGEAFERQGGVTVFADISGSVDRGAVKVIRRVLRLAREREGRVLLLIDEVDALNSAEPETLERLARVTEGHAVLLAGVGLDLERCPWPVEVLPVEPLSTEACRGLLTEPTAGLCSWEEAALDAVLERADGRPMLVQLYGLNCVERMGMLGRRVIQLADVLAVRESVDRAWQTIQDHGLEADIVPIDVDSARLELGRLLHEIEELELMLQGSS